MAAAPALFLFCCRLLHSTSLDHFSLSLPISFQRKHLVLICRGGRMFYSHQLLARKASLGQIWMAATMHAKMNRRKLDKLNLVKICEEILYPSVPMALRLSGILMGGVVIVYERKVKLLYDDVTRFLVELNNAWKGKAVPDLNEKALPNKTKVTLPENNYTDVLGGGIEQSCNYTHANTILGTSYITMCLDDDNLKEAYNADEPQNFHQADAENITLVDRYDPLMSNTNPFDRFERFDIEGDDEMTMNFNSGEQAQIPTNVIPSPPRQYEPQEANENGGPQIEHQDNQQNSPIMQEEQGHPMAGVPMQDEPMPARIRRRRRRPGALVMDAETVIPGPVYQSWLRDASDTISRRGTQRKRKVHATIISRKKVTELMDLPAVVLIDNLYTNGNGEVHYPASLLEQWYKRARVSDKSPSDGSYHHMDPEQASEARKERVYYNDPVEHHFEDLHSGVGSQSFNSLEKIRMDDVPKESLNANFINNSSGRTHANVIGTPGISVGDEVRSIPGSGSAHGVGWVSDSNVGRSNMKRYSSSGRGKNILETLDEHAESEHFKLSELAEDGPTPELLVETGPTQTQHTNFNQDDEKITEGIRKQMKNYFEEPGSNAVESLNKLATGMNRKAAAKLFYQTCVLATRNALKIKQTEAYGDIFISPGPNI